MIYKIKYRDVDTECTRFNQAYNIDRSIKTEQAAESRRNTD